MMLFIDFANLARIYPAKDALAALYTYSQLTFMLLQPFPAARAVQTTTGIE